jgi:hypothetical protein
MEAIKHYCKQEYEDGNVTATVVLVKFIRLASRTHDIAA